MGTIQIWSVIWILFVHLIADFFAQTHKMATLKSKSVKWLSIHVLSYSIITALGWLFYFKLYELFTVLFVFLFTFITHWSIDFVTSKITRHYYQRKMFHWFFVVIGIDQFLHFFTMLFTYFIIKNF